MLAFLMSLVLDVPVKVEDVRPGRVPFDRVERFTIHGEGFQVGGPVIVRVDGRVCPWVRVESDRLIVAETPSELFPGWVVVEVQTRQGRAQKRRAVAVTPCLEIEGGDVAEVGLGEDFDLRVLCERGDSIACFVGTEWTWEWDFPWVGWRNIADPTVAWYVPYALRWEHVETLTAPTDPALAGTELLFQCLVGQKAGSGVRSTAQSSWTRFGGRAYTECVVIELE